MDVRVVIPWRPASPERQRNFDFVSEYFERLGLPVVTADSGHERFNRAASRNAGVRANAAADVLIICDADFIPSMYAIKEAVDGALDGRLHYPFHEAVYLTPDETDVIMDGVGDPPDRAGGDLSGGCFVITPEAWFAAGGMDERFGVWGGEDDAFRVAASVLLGPCVNHLGRMHHLWHESESNVRGTAEHDANLALLHRYVAAVGSAEEIRAVLAS